jgi:transposase
VTEADRTEILRLSLEVELGTRQIAQRLDLTRKQVRTVVEAGRPVTSEEATKPEVPPAPGAAPGTESSLLDPFRAAIAERVEHRLTVTRICREITADGYRGARTILADYVRTLRAVRVPGRKQPKRRFETGPGLESQCDFGTYVVEIGGIPTVVQAFLCELACSRKASVDVFRDQRQSTVFEGLEGAGRDFEGFTKKVVLDNITSIVLGRTEVEPGKRKPILHPNAILFAEHHGFEFAPCRPRHPDRKGKDENLVGYFERDFIRGARFASWEDLRRRAREWCAQIANKRRHGTTGRVPDEAWREEERALLIRLPSSPFSVHRVEPRAVAPDATLSIGGTLYSVPTALSNTIVTVRLHAHHFEVVDEAGKVAMARSYVDPKDKGKLQLDPAHYAALPRTGRRERGRSKRLDETFRTRFPSLGPLVDGITKRMKTLAHVQLAALLRLAGRYDHATFLAAATRVQEAGRFDALAVQRLLEREQPLPDDPVPPLGGAGAVLLAEVEEGSLDRYDALDSRDASPPPPPPAGPDEPDAPPPSASDEEEAGHGT